MCRGGLGMGSLRWTGKVTYALSNTCQKVLGFTVADVSHCINNYLDKVNDSIKLVVGCPFLLGCRTDLARIFHVERLKGLYLCNAMHAMQRVSRPYCDDL